MFKDEKRKSIIFNTKFLVYTIVFFIVLLLASTIFMLSSNLKSAKAVETENIYRNSANSLTEASDYLTNSTYKYVVTENIDYYDNYIEEINVTKTREKSVETLLSLGVTDEEAATIQETLDLSNKLAEVEMYAFGLLQDEDSENDEEAEDIIFSEKYDEYKEKINNNYYTLINGIEARVSEESIKFIKLATFSFLVTLIISIGTVFSAVALLLNFYRMKAESDVDVMTGLQNRNKYKEKIQKLIDENPDKFGALIFCDIDNLKFINECYGHNNGDNYILEVANSLRIFEEYPSVLARPSGDEFVVYIHGFDSEKEMKEAINFKIKQARNTYFKTSMSVEEKIRFSTGISLYPTDSNKLDDLLKYSDYAMFKMKKNSKGEYTYYDKKTFDKSTFLLKNRGYLDELLEKELLDFAMQPIVDANTFEIYGYEALMRPQIDLINTPFLLLQLAKDESKLDKIERIVMKKALEKVQNNFEKLKNYKVFINSIADQILTREELDGYVVQYPDMFKNLIIEVTEQEYVDEEMLKFKIDMLKEYGLTIALDDYGAGYSNEFTLLSGFYEIVKIDMKLIRDIDVDVKRQEILKSIVNVSKYNNYKVLAEGVETENEVKILRKLGVNYFQGYYFGKPDLEIKPLSDEVLAKIKKIK